jgi:hypothetical protein
MSDTLEAFLAEFSQELEEIYQKQPAFTERPYRAHGSHVMVGGSGSGAAQGDPEPSRDHAGHRQASTV